MKIFISFLLLFYISEEIKSETNVFLISYSWNYDSYSFFVPLDTNKFPLLTHFPATAFLFVYKMNENKISNMTTKELKSLCFGGYTIDKFIPMEAWSSNLKYLKGFEDLYIELVKADEFGLAQNKQKYIDKLLEIYGNYYQEFEILKGDTLYCGQMCRSSIVEINEYEIKNNDSYNRMLSKKLFFNSDGYRVTMQDYDFEKQIMKLEFPYFVKMYKGNNNWNWDRIVSHYCTGELGDLISNHGFTDYISSDIAKKMIQGKNVGGEYFYWVKLNGELKNEYYSGGSKYLSGFDILKIKFVYDISEEGKWKRIYSKEFIN